MRYQARASRVAMCRGKEASQHGKLGFCLWALEPMITAVNTEHRQDLRFDMWAAVTGLAAAAAYYGYLSIQPACGAAGDTALGRSNSYVPWAILSAEILVVAGLGKLLSRRRSVIVTGVIGASLVAAIAAVLLFLAWFAAGDCGE